MPTSTSRYGLLKPTDADPFVTEDIAANWQGIDDKTVGYLSGPAGSRPAAAAANAGFLYLATSGAVSLSNGTEWIELASETTIFAKEGEVAVATGKGLWVPQYDVVLLGMAAAVGTAPVGAALNLALEQASDGTDLITGSVPDGATGFAESASTITQAAVTAGTRCRIDITQVGSTTAGADLTVFIRHARAV